MSPPSAWGVVQFDQLRGLNEDQLQSIAVAAISNMPIPTFSSSSGGDLSDASVATSLEATVPKSTDSLELDFTIKDQANVFELPPIAKTFPKFKKLAVELRNMIWKLSLPGPRIIDIIYDKDQDKYLSFRSKPPSLLHTNREARWVAQKIYNLTFPTQSHPANIYVRFDIDVLYFTNWLTGYISWNKDWFEHINIGPIGKKGLGRTDLRSIQRVAVNSVYFDVPRPSDDKLEYFLQSVLPVLTRFHSLVKLYVVVEDIDPYQRGEITFLDIPRNCHIHPDFCVFSEASNIIQAFGDLKWDLTLPWRVPRVSIVGAARGNHVSHMGQYQKCGCNGVPLPPGSIFRNHPCEAYIPNPVIVAGVVTEGESTYEVEDDLDEEDWGLDDNELEDLISDEEMYNQFTEDYCEGKYGVNHEQWVGIDYLLSRISL
ncbi:hypothetical protein NHQ30_006309 [Ciborinia camelliae]|nr:hypothetical protein NHQ30_006309 [Ciborinia camelliae]